MTFARFIDTGSSVVTFHFARRGRSAGQFHLDAVACPDPKKKGRSGERPKSREETPKEGDEYRDAVALPHCNKVDPARLLAKVKRSASLPVF